MSGTFIDTTTMSAVKSGTLQTGESYAIGYLNESHIPQISAFHNTVKNTLTKDEDAFLLDKSVDALEEHFSNGNGNAVMAIVLQETGQIIGQSIITNPSKEHPQTGMSDMQPVGWVDKTTVMGSVGVLQDYRGNNLMKQMVDIWLDDAAKAGKLDALAEIDINNTASWKTFLDCGLKLVGMGIDPSDGTLVYNAHESVQKAIGKRLAPLFNAEAKGEMFVAGQESLEWHQKLFKEGHKCVGYNKSQKTMIFEKNPPPKELTWFQLTR